MARVADGAGNPRRPVPRLTPPAALTTLRPDHRCGSMVWREPWAPIDSKHSCVRLPRPRRGAPRVASCPARRWPVSSVSAPDQRRHESGAIPVGVRTTKRRAAWANAAATAPASMSCAHRSTAARVPPSAPAPGQRCVSGGVAVSSKVKIRGVTVPPRAAPTVRRQPTGRGQLPNPAVKAIGRARAGSAPANAARIAPYSAVCGHTSGLSSRIGMIAHGTCPGRRSGRWSITVRDETTGECGVWDLRNLRRELAAVARGIVQQTLF